MIPFLSRPWPWYVAGPLIGLLVPALLVLGNRQFGFASNLRHLCAALLPRDVAFFKYDWKATGLWNLVFLAGTVVGGFIGGRALPTPHARPAGSAAHPPSRPRTHRRSGRPPPDAPHPRSPVVFRARPAVRHRVHEVTSGLLVPDPGDVRVPALLHVWCDRGAGRGPRPLHVVDKAASREDPHRQGNRDPAE